MPSSFTLTLVASTWSSTLPTRAAETLEGLGARAADPVWLADGEACDLPFDLPAAAPAEDVSSSRLAGVEHAVRQALNGEGVDLAVQGAEGRRKRLLVADMESTVIRNEMIDELADFAGCRDQVEGITARGMNGELDFGAALRERVALLRGLSVDVLEQSLERVEVTPGAATLVATLRAHGVYTALVSGGFGYFVERLRQRLGFDFQESNELEIEDRQLTGRVLEPIRDRAAKLRTLERLCREHGLTAAQTATVGDGANDLDMLRAAGLGVAFRAKPSVARAARFRVDHGDLTVLLYFQGYRRAEFHAV